MSVPAGAGICAVTGVFPIDRLPVRPESEETESIECAPEKPRFRTDHPLDKIAGFLVAKNILDSAGISRTDIKNVPITLSYHQRLRLNAILDHKLIFRIVQGGKVITSEKPLRDILKIIGAHNYLVGSYIFFLLGKEWCIEYLKNYVPESEIDQSLFEDWDRQPIDVDFRSYIQDPDTPVAKGFDVSGHIARSCQLRASIGYKWAKLREPGGGVKDFHRICYMTEQDSFLISFGGKLAVDILIVRLNAGDLVSTQNIKINVQSLLDGKLEQDVIVEANQALGEQAILDKLFKQYQFLRNAPKAWARGMVLDTDQYRHRGAIPPDIFLILKVYCEEFDTVAQGIAFLFNEYIPKHFKDDPNAIAALTFNICSSLYQNGFESEDLGELWAIMFDKIKDKLALMDPLLRVVIEAGRGLPFEVFMALMQVEKFLDLYSQAASQRSHRGSHDYIVTHNANDCIMVKRGPYAMLVPFRPLQALQKVLEAIDSKIPIGDFLTQWKGVFSYQTNADSTLVRNFRADDLEINKLVSLSLRLIKTADPACKSLGCKMLFVLHQYCPLGEELQEILAQFFTLYDAITDEDKKFFLEFLKGAFCHYQALHQGFESIARIGTTKQLLEAMAATFPALTLKLIQDKPKIFEGQYQVFENILRSFKNKTPSREDLELLVKMASKCLINDYQSQEETAALFGMYVDAMSDSGKVSTAAQLLYSATRSGIYPHNSETALKWYGFCSKHYSSHQKIVIDLVIAGDGFELWERPPRLLPAPGNIAACIEALYQLRDIKAKKAASAMLRYVSANLKVGQNEKLTELIDRQKTSEQKLREANEQLLEEEQLLRDQYNSPEVTYNELRRKYIELIKRGLAINMEVAQRTFLARDVWMLFYEAPNEFFTLYLQYFEKASENKNCLTNAFLNALEIPLDKSLRSLIEKVESTLIARYLSVISKVLVHPAYLEFPFTLVETIAIDLGYWLGVLASSAEVYKTVHFLKAFLNVKGSLRCSTQFYLDYFDDILRDSLSGRNSAQSLQEDILIIFKKLDIDSESDNVGSLIASYTFIVDQLIQTKHNIVYDLINRLLGFNKDLSQCYLRWAEEFSRQKNFKLAALLLKTVDEKCSDTLRRSADLSGKFPDEVLKLVPRIFINELLIRNPEKLGESALIRRINLLVRQVFKDQLFVNAGDLALQLVEKYSGVTDPAVMTTFEQLIEARNLNLCQRAWKIYQAKAQSLENASELFHDSEFSSKWFRAWMSAQKILQIAYSINLHVLGIKIADQIDSIKQVGSPLHQFFVSSDKIQERNAIFFNLLEQAFRYWSSSEDNLLKMNELLDQYEREDSDPLLAHQLRHLLMLKTISSSQKVHFAKGCAYILSLMSRLETNVGELAGIIEMAARNAKIRNGFSSVNNFKEVLYNIKFGRTPLDLVQLAYKSDAVTHFIGRTPPTRRERLTHFKHFRFEWELSQNLSKAAAYINEVSRPLLNEFIPMLNDEMHSWRKCFYIPMMLYSMLHSVLYLLAIPYANKNRMNRAGYTDITANKIVVIAIYSILNIMFQKFLLGYFYGSKPDEGNSRRRRKR